MTNNEFARMVLKCIENAEHEAQGKVFILKPETMIKLEKISRDMKCRYSIEFDAAFNALDITLKEFVFDSHSSGIKTAFNVADIFVIDAEADGKVNIELRLLNVATLL